ncbi:MAG: hypothetical protein U9N83_05870 [Thermodesulfobacteriota bacterium]|nr:hypothetical protein [Thermodesulfobacteriota bacterium]
MKKMICVLAALMLVFGIAGQAMAAFTMGDLQLVAYEEPDNLIPVSSAGNEVHFDLGMGQKTGAAVSNIDTGILLGDFSVTTWSDVYVGIFGGGYNTSWGNEDALFTSDSADFTVGGGYSSFQSNVVNNSSATYMSNTDTKQTYLKSNLNLYVQGMDQGGNNVGNYGAYLNVRDDFGGELQLMDDSILNVGLYSAGDRTAATLLGSFSLDTTGSELVVSYAPTAVPIPGSLLLLGSGLAGIVGFRRRNRV